MREQIEMELVSRYDNNGNYTNDDVIEAVKIATGQEIEQGTETITTDKGNKVDISDLWTTNGLTKVSELETGEYVLYEAKTGDNIICKVIYDGASSQGLSIMPVESVGDVTLGLETSTTDNDALGTEVAEYYSKIIDILNEKCADYVNEKFSEKCRCIGSPLWLQDGNWLDNDDAYNVSYLDGYVDFSKSFSRYFTDLPNWEYYSYPYIHSSEYKLIDSSQEVWLRCGG